MLVEAAVCPYPPLLVPAAAGQHDAAGTSLPDAELAEIRTACELVVAGLAARRPDVIVVVGGADQTRAYPGPAAGDLQQYGIPFATGAGDLVLPLSLTIGAWLVRQSGWCTERAAFQAVRQDAPTQDCLRLGARLAAIAERVAMLVMGDGPARPAVRTPGAADPESDEYAAVVESALATGDVAGLVELDPARDEALLVSGRAAWQVLAGAAEGRTVRGQLHRAAAPYGVRYAVASWQTGSPGG